jgi:hypothetical protein
VLSEASQILLKIDFCVCVIGTALFQFSSPGAAPRRGVPSPRGRANRAIAPARLVVTRPGPLAARARGDALLAHWRH